MKYLIVKLLLSVFCLGLGYSAQSQDNTTPKMKLNKKQRFAKLFGFGKKTKNVAIVAPVVPKRQGMIKTDAQRQNLNKLAQNLPVAQRRDFFAQDRQQKYAMARQAKAQRRANAYQKQIRQAQTPQRNGPEGGRNVALSNPPSVPSALPKPAVPPRVQKNNAQAKSPIVNPRITSGSRPQNGPQTPAPSNRVRKTNNAPAKSPIPNPRITSGSRLYGFSQNGSQTPAPSNSNARQNSSNQKSYMGKLPSPSNLSASSNSRVQTPVAQNKPGQNGNGQNNRNASSSSSSGQNHGQIPSRSGVIYSKLPGKTNSAPHVYKPENIKDQLNKVNNSAPQPPQPSRRTITEVQKMKAESNASRQPKAVPRKPVVPQRAAGSKRSTTAQKNSAQLAKEAAAKTKAAQAKRDRQAALNKKLEAKKIAAQRAREAAKKRVERKKNRGRF